MGIVNIILSIVIIFVILGCDLLEVIGIGVGFKKERLKYKVEVIRKVIEINNLNLIDGVDILFKVGGFEIGLMVGVILGCSVNRILVVIDGFIFYVVVLIVYKINLKIREYMIVFYLLVELGIKRVLDILKLDFLLNMDMRLGEGSGVVLVFDIIEVLNYIYKNMVIFDEIDMGR